MFILNGIFFRVKVHFKFEIEYIFKCLSSYFYEKQEKVKFQLRSCSNYCFLVQMHALSLGCQWLMIFDLCWHICTVNANYGWISQAKNHRISQLIINTAGFLISISSAVFIRIKIYSHIVWYHRYATQNIELEYRLMPFIPDFIPAVGDIDAFIKVCVGSPTCWLLLSHLLSPVVKMY